MPYKDKEARREAQRRWKKANRDHINEQARLSYKTNPQRQQKATKKWRDKNPESVRAKNQARNKSNRDKCNAATARYRKAHPKPRTEERIPMSAEERRIKQKAWHKRSRIKNREKRNKDSKIWSLNNKDRHKESIHQWNVKNPDKVRAKSLRYYHTHKDKQQVRNLKWRKANPEALRAITHRRRARERSARGSSSAKQIADRAAYYGNMCAYCRIAPYEHIDHVIPMIRGGTQWPANLRPACAYCNVSKGSKTLSEWKGPSNEKRI